ncbi:MAG: 2-amino-4-hydroxy-6-hydroxymethyldihydropteridine diphosphokinase [Bacteroidales bacterium]|nr:2-amino-4-hydroxy-6-hydroxymethyldihydropteridine diphosphokinase [Bacteroidales bacterium]
MARVFLGLGSNLGDGRANLNRALDLIVANVGPLLAVSDFIESEPWGFASEHRFTNAVCAVETGLGPMALLDITQEIERQMGRTHKHAAGESYTDRIIDIDILTYDDVTMHNERLTLPHPLIGQRDFVKIPLQDCLNKLSK